ncbi:MAG: hypothetical protein AAGD00_04725 [Planctomycetota bacterium]
MPQEGTPHAPPLREDHERREAFLTALRTGLVGPVEAARRASPHLAESTNEQAGYSAFRRLRENDPRFAAEWDRALVEGREMLQAQLQELALDWVVNPSRRPVFEDGKVVGWVEDRNAAAKVLLRMLAKIDPTWSERRQLEHSGGVNHDHRHVHAHVEVDSASTLKIDASHLHLLGEEKADQLVALVAELRERVAESEPLKNNRPALEAPSHE